MMEDQTRREEIIQRQKTKLIDYREKIERLEQNLIENHKYNFVVSEENKELEEEVNMLKKQAGNCISCLVTKDY